MINAIVITLHALIAAVVIFLVLLHSGRDAGLSGAFGVGGSGGSHGGSTAVVERNLDRLTVIFSVLFFITTYILTKRL